MKYLITFFLVIITSNHVFGNDIGKVVMTYKSHEEYFTHEPGNGFEYKLYIGCRYIGEVTNQTNYPIALGSFGFIGYLPSPWNAKWEGHSYDYTRKVLMPGDKSPIRFTFNNYWQLDKKLDDETLSKAIPQYGCPGQIENGNIVITGSWGQKKIVQFSPDSGIKDANKYFTIDDTFPIQIKLDAGVTYF